jgi:hypothetical protein
LPEVLAALLEGSAGGAQVKKEKPRESRDWWLVELSLDFTWWWTTLTFL